MTSVGKDVEILEASYIVCGRVIWYSQLGKQLGSFSKCQTQSSPMNQEIYSYICNMFTQNLLLEFSKSRGNPNDSNWWTDELHMVYPLNGLLFGTTVISTATIWIILENVMLSEISYLQKPHSVWFHLYKVAIMSNSLRQDVDSWLPRAGEGGIWEVIGEWLLI